MENLARYGMVGGTVLAITFWSTVRAETPVERGSYLVNTIKDVSR